MDKLPIKSMFNSDDCRPLTEKLEAFHLYKDPEKKRVVGSVGKEGMEGGWRVRTDRIKENPISYSVSLAKRWSRLSSRAASQ